MQHTKLGLLKLIVRQQALILERMADVKQSVIELNTQISDLGTIATELDADTTAVLADLTQTDDPDVVAAVGVLTGIVTQIGTAVQQLTDAVNAPAPAPAPSGGARQFPKGNGTRR